MQFKVGCFIGYFHPPEKLANRKNLYLWVGLLIKIIKETGNFTTIIGFVIWQPFVSLAIFYTRLYIIQVKWQSQL